MYGEKDLDAKRNMRDFFIVPPFSIINTMDESWQRRRQRWLKISGDLTQLTWIGSVKDGEDIEFLTTKGLEHYGVKIYTFPAYIGVPEVGY